MKLSDIKSQKPLTTKKLKDRTSQTDGAIEKFSQRKLAADQISNKELIELTDLDKNDVIRLIELAENGQRTKREVIYELKTKKAYKAMGCRSWKKFCKKYLRNIGTVGNVDREVKAAIVETRLTLPIGTLLGSPTRDLYSLPDDELQTVWAAACKLHSKKGFPTASEIDFVIADMNQLQKSLDFINVATMDQCTKMLLALKNRFPKKSDRRTLVKSLVLGKKSTVDGTLAKLMATDKHSYPNNGANDDHISDSYIGDKQADDNDWVNV